MSPGCVWDCLVEFLGYSLAITLLGLLLAALAGYMAASGGAGAVTLPAIVEGALAASGGIAALKLTGVGIGGIIGSIVGCLRAC